MRKSRWFKWSIRVLLLVLVFGGWWLARLIWFKPLNINHFYDRVFIGFMLQNPELLTGMRILESVGLKFHNDDLTDASPEFDRKMLEYSKENLRILESYELDEQSPSQQLSTRILTWFLDDRVREEPFIFYNYPVNQMAGVQSRLPSFMTDTHQIDEHKDAVHYIRRLNKFHLKFEQVIDGLRVRESLGIIPPRFVIDRVLKEMRAFIGVPEREHLLCTNLKAKLDEASIEYGSLLQEAEQAVRISVYPAYRELINYFEELSTRATDDDGVWKFPGGDAFYRHALRSHTTTDFTPEEVYQLGLAEVSRIESEIMMILKEHGMNAATTGAGIKQVSEDPRFLYENNDSGRQACLRDFQEIINEIDRGLSSSFDFRPSAGVEVRRVPIFKEKTAPGAYYSSPPLDGSRPGVFYANLRNMREIPKWSMRTLAYHEAVPGHHYQHAVQQELQGVPTFRKVIPFTAYSEGWALYAERLAWELGFQDDPWNNLGRLRDEMMRAVRLVVDTGIHYKRWTRLQAIKYMEEKTGLHHDDVVSEVERYIVNPGQACAYKVGQLKILELRARAKTELGDDFDLKAFHHVLLANGSVPLEILEDLVDSYILRTIQSI